MGPQDLGEVLQKLHIPHNPKILANWEGWEDATLYQLGSGLMMVQTVDIITPVVDDPYDFGQIVAANAISDIYTMGCLPELALNIVGFPCSKLPLDILSSILKGGQDKAEEAGVEIAGGHTVEDEELKYGMVVTGFGNKDSLWRIKGAEDGDVLILTKPLGTGIIATTLKAEMASKEAVEKITKSMKKLNNLPLIIRDRDFRIHACTDVTGFGLAVHALGMVDGSKLGIKIEVEKIPVFEEVLRYMSEGLMPAGAYRNEKWASGKVEVKKDGFDPIILFDPQTSGGLLIAVPLPEGERLLEIIKRNGFEEAEIIGSFIKDAEEKIVFI